MAKGKFAYWLTEEGLILLRQWARDGYTDDQIAERIGISRGTFYAWKKRFPDFDDALKKGKEVIDSEVEEALIKSALGYTWEEKEYKTDEDGEMKLVKVTTKFTPPNPTAMIFWLKNRRPGQWRDKVQQEITTALPVVISDDLPDDEGRDTE